MTEDKILDNFKEFDPRVIQEPFEYRILLTLSWLIWSVWSFYDGTIVLELVIEGRRGLFTFFPYNMKMVYYHYFMGGLTLGMGVMVFRQSEHRISYLFSFLGIYLTILLTDKITEGVGVVFIPMIIVLLVKNLRACLICYALSLVLYLLSSHSILDQIESLLTSPTLLVIYSLIFMSGISYRAKLFPLKEVVIKLRYRALFLLGFLPLAIGYIFKKKQVINNE
jgi:hypothetical protein